MTDAMKRVCDKALQETAVAIEDMENCIVILDFYIKNEEGEAQQKALNEKKALESAKAYLERAHTFIVKSKNTELWQSF